MTERELRGLVAELALRYEGVVQGSAEHRLLIDTYNSWFVGNYPRGHKATYTESWCMEAADAWAIMARTISVVPNECGCYEAVNIAKALGEWRDRTYSPQVADLVFFDWDNDGVANHVGYVVEVTADEIVTVEGNAQNNECRSNRYPRNDARILGYCAPDYASLVTSPAPEKPDYATDYAPELAGEYSVTTGLYLRPRPNVLNVPKAVMPKGATVTANGWYAENGSTRWLYVTYAGLTGYCSSKYLKTI